MSDPTVPVGGAVSRRWRGRLAVAEALVWLPVGAALQRWVPMPWWSGLLGDTTEVPGDWRGRTVARLPRRTADDAERRVTRAIERGTELLGGRPSCLAQATAGQVMLRTRRRAGVVVIGLRRTEDPEADWDAHAWLLGRRGELCGGPAASGFTATTVFEVRGRLRADAVDLSPGPATGAD